ncbi:galactoside 2-alpha-L-fucosyltransferase SEC1-like [Tubulanus polymorphus]|uniref:galactoside 2-alpha-L-fucosyltransferase SEC1-like n=1 Tax=Tubulanus polymorphus TaxID=672921 RepID=UPI003DA4D7E7
MMTASFMERTGNLMFQYAALFSISKNHGAIPVIPTNFQLAIMYELTAPSAVLEEPVTEVFRERYACKFDSRIRNINIAGLYASRVTGYLQSWKYFRNDTEEIRKQFSFRRHIKRAAVNFIDRNKYNLSLLTGAKITTIGIHVRRGDMITYSNFGYVTVPVSYLRNAMDYMTSLYGQNTLFIVTSDDIPWCERNVPNKTEKVVFSKAKDPSLDMAILSSCEHVIISTGTFGWWAAWLASGTTIYYKDWPRKNSSLARLVSHDDYFPPHWVGLSG